MESSLCSAPLIEGLLGRPPPSSALLIETVASSSARPDLGALSAAIDSSAFERLLSSAPTTRSRALDPTTG